MVALFRKHLPDRYVSKSNSDATYKVKVTVLISEPFIVGKLAKLICITRVGIDCTSMSFPPKEISSPASRFTMAGLEPLPIL